MSQAATRKASVERKTRETEIRLDLKRRADAEATGVFAGNLRELLLAAPLGRKRVLALDPGFRTGCKLVVHSGKKYKTMKPAELEGYEGERGRRGLKLSQGYRAVDRLVVEC